MEVILPHQEEQFCYIKLCLEKIHNSNYNLDESAFIDDLQILNNYQNYDILKVQNHFQNLKQYLVSLQDEEKKFFLNDLIRFIASLALKQQELWPNKGLKYLIADQEDEISYTKYEISVLLANMFLLSIGRRSKFGDKKLPDPCSKVCYNFIFKISGTCMQAKLKCIHAYFKRIYQRRDDQKYLNLIVTFKRQLFKEDMLKNNQITTFGDIEISSNRKIEDFSEIESIHTDFANEYIGGGALYDGNVQEEILFNIKPELLVSMIFCQKMNKNEAILIMGAEKFCKYTGYGHTFDITEEYYDNTPINEKFNRLKTYSTCIDATYYQSHSQIFQQYNEEHVQREIVKSLAGFQDINEEERNESNKFPIISGNWGCGMFNGDPQLKLLIQWISCSLHNRKLIYCSLNHNSLEKQTEFIYSLKGKEINQILQKIQKYSQSSKNMTLFQFLQKN